MEVSSSLSQRLIKARSGHEWTQAELAEVSGIAAAQISRYEAGRSAPRPEIVAKLAKALAVGFEWLAYGQGDMDIGADVPTYPGSQSSEMSIDIDPELDEALNAYANKQGLTREMAFRKLAMDGLRRANENPEAFAQMVVATKNRRQAQPPGDDQ